jgi:pimeloyl-ACP methyl ester carboxylesterase
LTSRKVGRHHAIDVRPVDLRGDDGLRLRADELGDSDGPPVLLLHGGGQTRHAWGSTARVLAALGWHAFQIDLRGHGESDWPANADYRLERFADDIRTMAEELSEPPVLVGASLGGSASMIALGTPPVLDARALVLVDVAPKIELEGGKRIADFMTEHLEDGFGSLEEVADAIAAYNPHRPRPSDLSGLEKNVRLREDGRWVWHWDPRLMRGSEIDSRVTMEQWGRLRVAARGITVPTLLVRGRLSDLLSEEGARDLLDLIPHAEYTDVAGAGHMVAGDKNDLFNDAIVDFLQRLRSTKPA